MHSNPLPLPCHLRRSRDSPLSLGGCSYSVQPMLMETVRCESTSERGWFELEMGHPWQLLRLVHAIYKN